MPLSECAKQLDAADAPCAPLPHAERLAPCIYATRRRRITAAHLFGIAIEIAAGLVALVAVLALVA